ncbi:MAG: glucuronate isomerase [Gemmatales bacterium]|nr:glucuronate isomerase [Gemmatales bacterium]MDW7994096.1 glucuronate isomerase [Gemmatales bacterium]
MADIRLVNELYEQIAKIPIRDPHTHISPRSPAARSLDDILGYHYYTELAHSAGMSHGPLQADFPARERCRILLTFLERFDNTVQATWLVEIAQTFLGFPKNRIRAEDADWLWQRAEEVMAQPDWARHVIQRSNIEQIFLTNDFDDPLKGFDTQFYVPCLRTDDLVFRLHLPEVRERLARATGIELGRLEHVQEALERLFHHFVSHGARACAISLPPDFTPMPPEPGASIRLDAPSPELSRWVFWKLAECCRHYKLPFDLMIGVHRGVYKHGVYQGQDLFDQRTSLWQYRELFNAFPQVTFCVSILSSIQNAELVAYSWIFPNVIASGHWWYSNLPGFIRHDLSTRLQGVPKTKLVGYYSDAYKLEFVLPKFNMFRRVLAEVLADEYIQGRGWSEEAALQLARQILYDNIAVIFPPSSPRK